MPIEREPSGSHIEIIRKAIDESPREIEREFERTANTWLACVNTRLQVIVAHLDLAELDGELSAENTERYRTSLQPIVGRVRGLMEVYPRKEDEVPSEIKKEILLGLDILKE